MVGLCLFLWHWPRVFLVSLYQHNNGDTSNHVTLWQWWHFSKAQKVTPQTPLKDNHCLYNNHASLLTLTPVQVAVFLNHAVTGRIEMQLKILVKTGKLPRG